jgi:hypothetical protein
VAFQRQVANIGALDEDSPLVGIVEPFNEVDDGGFAHAGGAQEGTVNLLVDKGFWGSFGSGWGGCGTVVRRLLGSVR